MLNKIGIFLKKILRALNLFTKSFVNMFFDNTWSFFDSSFKLFSTRTCFVFFEVKFLFDFL